ncbi:MAG: hypothetical protein C5B52_07050 [Bacteroidetes bacterium]|nr:MAG: hypothetical protein C5B52_07050 [Bacteroidota bacterium]
MNYSAKTTDYCLEVAVQPAIPARIVKGIIPIKRKPAKARIKNESEKVLRGVKKSFLVFKNNKYSTVSTDSIAFFYIKLERSTIITNDGIEYMVNHSLHQIQHLVSDQQFFRLNRQCLVNFQFVKEVEHYFGRKLIVKTSVPFAGRLLVSKERSRIFLNWLDDR